MGGKGTIQYFNVNGIYTVFLHFQLREILSRSWKVLHKIKHLRQHGDTLVIIAQMLLHRQGYL